MRNGKRRVTGRALLAPAVALAATGVLVGVWSAATGELGTGVLGTDAKRPSSTHVTRLRTRRLAPANLDPLAPQRVSPQIAHAAEGGGKAVNITVDDGPDPVWTQRILQVLEENGAHATFCMIGPHAAAYPKVVREVVAQGDRLCDHTVSHNIRMDHMPDAYQQSQILGAERMIQRASGGIPPLYYRAPGGAFTPYSRRVAASHGMRPLGWNIDSRDFSRPGTAQIVATVRYELPNGPTILFHDGGGNRAQTVQALGQLLPWLKRQGYRFSFPVR